MSAFTVQTSIEGNLTRDPELRYTSTGMPVANMRVACTSRSQRPDGSFTEQTQYLTVVCWSELGTNVAASLHKGDRVIVSGNFKQRTYQNKDGNNVYVWELHANQVGISLRWHVVAGIEKAREALAQPESDEVLVA